jgi:hypothetical protein
MPNQADFFAEIGSAGGASTLGMTENDPPCSSSLCRWVKA